MAEAKTDPQKPDPKSKNVDDAAKVLNKSKAATTENANDGNDPDPSGEKASTTPGEDENYMRLPSPEDEERGAQHLATHPEMIIVWDRVRAKAQQIIDAANQPAPLSADELAAEKYNQLVKRYGKDFVTAQRGTNNMYFTRISWNSMGTHKQGWKEVSAVMPEVAEAEKEVE